MDTDLDSERENFWSEQTRKINNLFFFHSAGQNIYLDIDFFRIKNNYSFYEKSNVLSI